MASYMIARQRKRRRYTRRDLTGRTRREALAIAKTLLPGAKKGNLEDAAMLVDMAVYAGKEHAAEALQLALQGRSYSGQRLVPEAAARNLKSWIDNIGRELFPPRGKPCLPNRRAFRQLVNETLDPDTASDRKLASALWKAIVEACQSGSWKSIERAIRLANDTLRGHGVETISVETARGPGVSDGNLEQSELTLDYVNFGDTYSNTLVFDYYLHRFRVTSWGDVVEAWENRWGRVDDGEY